MQQKRLIIALLISTAILFAWSYLVPVKPPQSGSSPSASTPHAATIPSPNPQNRASTPLQSGAQASHPDQEPRRTIAVKTPLYEVKLDSRGAEVVSWIIRKNKQTGRPIYSVAGNQKKEVPLELVSAKSLEREPREAPLQLLTGDTLVDGVLASSNYRVDGAGENGDAELNLAPGEQKQITFRLSDKGTGLELAKTIVF